MQGEKQDFVALTTLRAVGALCVLEHHAWLFVQPAWPKSWFVLSMQLWPDYFFVLSGFILTHVYGETLRARSVTGIYNYLVHRVARVYPLHVFMLILLVGFEVLRSWAAQNSGADLHHPIFSGSTDPKYLPSNFLLIQAWGFNDLNSWNAPAWSVSAEFACYLLFPFIVQMGLARNRLYAAAITILSLLGLLAIQLKRHTLDVTYDLAVPRALFSFCLGCVLYHQRPLLLGALRRVPPAMLQLAVICAVILGYVLNIKGILFIPLWVLLIASLTYERTWVARALSWRPLVKLGDMSYSIYLVHWLVLSAFLLFMQTEPAWARYFLMLPPFGLLLFFVIATIALSFLTYRYVEVPGRSAVRRRLAIRLNRAGLQSPIAEKATS